MKREKLAAVFFAAVTMLVFAASAGAADGTIEINQAKVLANGGFPYTIGTGSYRLTGNLTVPSGTNGINVNAANVTIDLNGFSIIGPLTTLTSATPIGIDAFEILVTVENGIVTGFGTGVEVGGGGIIRNVHVDGNFNGIEASNNSVVTGCTANNGNVGGTGIACAATCTISGNTANGDGAGGITCGGDACVISGNTASDDGVGIHCKGSGCLISGNTVTSAGTYPIEASDATTGYGGNVLAGLVVSLGGTSFGNNVCTTLSGTVIC
ncbi:MAG: NosD domain-containing protein [Candidatus Binatus sp.]|jgi:parallel beta-helix repeat protein|uniref:NosD domain-containing protein n=1 Tax=Candidatus Binatus sp. TaxID=2811406 RepID=UPI003C74D8EC